MRLNVLLLALLLAPALVAQEIPCPAVYPPDACDANVVGVSPPPPRALTVGSLACWNLDEASGTRFDDCGSNDLSDPATIDVVPGISNNGVREEFLAADCLTGSLVSLGNEWTVNAWAAGLDDLTETGFANGEMTFQGRLTASGNFPGIAILGTSLGCVFREGPPGYNPASSTYYMYTAWLHPSDGAVHCQVHDASGNAGPELVGVSDTMPTLTGSLMVGGPCAVGFFGPSTGFDELSFWDRAFTAAERLELVTTFAPF